MKKTLFLLAFLISTFIAHAQDTSGMIAHWNMNSNTNDISGNGLNGHSNNLTPAAGADGVMGHAWYFNGVNSSITIPYSPLLNVSAYTIAATLKVNGFYTGTCQGNTIFLRGKTDVESGSYYLVFTDYPAGYGCTTAINTDLEVFMPNACATSSGLTPWPFTPFDYTPHIEEYKWYNVIATFNDTVFKVYVNGVLKSTVFSPLAGTPIGWSTDSASIGYDIYEAAFGYPYPFNGVMDDLRIYNRALTDSEVMHINDTCGLITLQPATAYLGESGGTITYTVNTSISGAAYQWQENAGTGFANLSNTGPYSGVTTPTLTVTGATTAMTDYLYRCLISNSWGCSDTTSPASLLTLGINNLSASEITVSVFPNPAGAQLTVQSNKLITHLTITNLLGQTVYNQLQTANYKLQTIDVSTLPSGLYFVKVNNTEVRKFVKQ